MTCLSATDHLYEDYGHLWCAGDLVFKTGYDVEEQITLEDGCSLFGEYFFVYRRTLIELHQS